MMKIYPAIDLLGGKAVRLLEGKKSETTVYSDAPWEVAAGFAAAGAGRIHVVDLDGAFEGTRQHREIIKRIVAAANVPIEVGGGVRDRAALDEVFASGAQLAVLGTAAVKSPAFVEAACRSFPGQIVVAVDARDGWVAVEGWVEASTVRADELAARAADWGAAGILYTDIARDGAKRGPNVEATAALHRAVGDRCEVIASGGVSSLDDLRALAAAEIPAVVIGRALYDGVFTVAQAIEVASRC